MKVLIIRFSSIGDIILTSPIARCLSKQLNAEVHFLTKSAFTPLVEHNAYIQKVFGFEDDYTISKELQEESYDLVVDLHNNIRSKRIRSNLKTKFVTYDKQSFNRFLLVNLKIDRLKGYHIVDRYFSALGSYPLKNDKQGLDFFFPEYISVSNLPKRYVAIAIGTAHFTKNIPSNLILDFIDKMKLPIVLVGGQDYKVQSDGIVNDANVEVFNLVGATSLLQSAYVLQQSVLVVSPDTGMLHMAAALKKPLIAIYGSTSSKLGFTPYMPGYEDRYEVIENSLLSCRPCTKQGKSSCPKGHFKCMMDLDSTEIVEKARQLIEN